MLNARVPLTYFAYVRKSYAYYLTKMFGGNFNQEGGTRAFKKMYEAIERQS